jgi:hypothetical protein
MDKKVMYALIGGVAVVGAAVAFHLMSGKSEVEDALDGDLEQLGPLKLDDQNRIEFDQFLKLF